MLRTSTRKLLVLLPLLGVVYAWGCHPYGGGRTRPSVRAHVCPSFQLNSTPVPVNVGPQGGTVDLGDGTSITFAQGAVTGNASYTVNYAANDQNQRLAGFSIDPVNGAPTTFRAPVTIQISYGKCVPAGNPVMTIVTIENGKPGHNIGGHQDAHAQNVHVDVGHFTEYAIAL